MTAFLKALFKRLLEQNPSELKSIFMSLVFALALTLLLQINLAKQKAHFLTKNKRSVSLEKSVKPLK